MPAGMAGCTLTYIIPAETDSKTTIAIYTTVLAVTFLLSLVRHSWGARVEGAVMTGAITLFSFVYLGLLPGFFLAIRRWHSAWIIIAVFLIIKCCDIGAYFTGRAIGKHKLIPWLSPGKTWEGLAGGVLLSTLVALGLAALNNGLELAMSRDLSAGEVPRMVHQHYPLWYAILTGAIFGLVGQFGDLVASLFKRDAGIKDSGRTIPGFGGIIDVIDSPIVVAPVAYWMLYFVSTAARW